MNRRRILEPQYANHPHRPLESRTSDLQEACRPVGREVDRKVARGANPLADTVLIYPWIVLVSPVQQLKERYSNISHLCLFNRPYSKNMFSYFH